MPSPPLCVPSRSWALYASRPRFHTQAPALVRVFCRQLRLLRCPDTSHRSLFLACRPRWRMSPGLTSSCRAPHLLLSHMSVRATSASYIRRRLPIPMSTIRPRLLTHTTTACRRPCIPTLAPLPHWRMTLMRPHPAVVSPYLFHLLPSLLPPPFLESRMGSWTRRRRFYRTHWQTLRDMERQVGQEGRTFLTCWGRYWMCSMSNGSNRGREGEKMERKWQMECWCQRLFERYSSLAYG